MRRWLAIAVVFALAACGQPGGPSAQSAKTGSPRASPRTPTPVSTTSPTATNRAVDTYPSAPQVSSAFLGNGVYGNAFLLSGPDAWVLGRRGLASHQRAYAGFTTYASG